jgi:hypothetical protein
MERSDADLEYLCCGSGSGIIIPDPDRTKNGMKKFSKTQ